MKKIISKARSILRKNGFDLTRHKELPEWLDLHPIDIVLDIGANDGRYAAEIREAGWKDRIVSVEPQLLSLRSCLRKRMHGMTASVTQYASPNISAPSFMQST